MANTNKKLSCTKKVIYVIIGVCAFAIVISGLALGITDIVIGAKFLHSDCHIHDLPKYLVVMGVFSIVNFLILILCNIGKRESNTDPTTCEYLFTFISIGIGIWGMTLVWNSEQDTCPSTLYNYAYYRTVVFVFIITAIFAIALIFMIGSACCGCFCEPCIDMCLQWDNVSDIEITNANTKSMPPGISSSSLDENKNRAHELSTIRDNILNLSNKNVIIDINTQESSPTGYSTV